MVALGRGEGDLRAQLSAEGNVAAFAALEDFLADLGTCAPTARASTFGFAA